MARALAYAESLSPPLELARVAVVCACAFALILAGQALPL